LPSRLTPLQGEICRDVDEQGVHCVEREKDENSELTVNGCIEMVGVEEKIDFVLVRIF
jgi:hypothetical protein